MAGGRPGEAHARPARHDGVWQRQAAGYHRFFSQFTIPVTGPLLDAARVTAASQVLDVATGPGYAAHAARGRGARVLATDLSPAMLAQARRAWPGLALVRADAGRLPVPSGAFTAVTGNFYAAHMPDPEAGAIELARVLAPGGCLALSAWDDAPGSHPAALLAQAIADVTGTPGRSMLPSGAAALPGLLRGAGLCGVTARAIRWIQPLAGAETLWDGLLASPVTAAAAFLAASPAAQQQIRERFRTLTAPLTGSAGTLRLPVGAVVTAAQRP